MAAVFYIRAASASRTASSGEAAFDKAPFTVCNVTFYRFHLTRVGNRDWESLNYTGCLQKRSSRHRRFKITSCWHFLIICLNRVLSFKYVDWCSEGMGRQGGWVVGIFFPWISCIFIKGHHYFHLPPFVVLIQVYEKNSLIYDL